MKIPHDFTVRTTDGQSRITYKPDWSPSRPWCVYHHGTATGCFHSLWNAMSYMEHYYWLRFKLTAAEYLAEFK